MLRFFTRLEKTRNFVLFLFAILMVLGLVLFYTPVRNQYQANLTHSTETAASVAGEKISVGEVVRQKENYNRFMRGQTTPTKTVLDGLIGGRITRIEAERLGLTASDKEVADEIRRQYKGEGEDQKPFDQKIYEQNVIENYGNIESYEQRVRDDLSSKKLEAYLTSGVTVSEQEMLDAIRVLLLDEHVVAEASGAAATAAYLQNPSAYADGNIILLITGANLSPDVLRRAVMQIDGLSDGRLL